MDNIIIYTDMPLVSYEAALADIDEVNVRVVKGAELKDFATHNPSLIIIDEVASFKDVLMTNKLPCPILFAGNIFTDFTVRAEGYDFIQKPVNTTELLIRVKSLLKIKQYKDKIEKVSTTDDLTGLHNRKYLQERLESEISRARRYGTRLSCLLFDIDFFKVVNDMYGYEWGDILLRNLANSTEGSGKLLHSL